MVVRLFGCLEGNPDFPNMSDALESFQEGSFEVYEDQEIQKQSPAAELAYSVKKQQDYLYSFVTILIDLSKSVASKEEYLNNLKQAVKTLVASLIPQQPPKGWHKLKLQILAFAGRIGNSKWSGAAFTQN